MFKPHRFNPLLRAFPNHSHEEHVKQAAAARGGGHTTQVVESVKTTEVTSHGHTHETTEAAATVKTTEASHGHAHATTEAVAAVETRDVKHGHNGETTTQSATVVETTEILSRVHATSEGVAAVEMTPPHPPREETPEYAKAHQHLAIALDSPCAMCGVRNSTLKDPKQNPFGAQAIETHHYPVERSLLDACDPAKVGVVFPHVKDHASLEAFVDSEENLMVLCDIHHRHPLHGIHHLVPQDFFIQPFLVTGYQVVTTQDQEAKVESQDEGLVDKELKK